MQTIEGYIHDLISHKFDKHVYCYYYNQEILYPFLCLRLEGKVVFSMTMISSITMNKIGRYMVWSCCIQFLNYTFLI